MTEEIGSPFSVRRFLRERKALLVHFSTPMSRHEYLFPDDLRNAMKLVETPISFSTILSDDVGPHSHPGMAPHEANADGSVGIVVDVDDVGSVLTVGPGDSGTSFDEITGRFASGGSPPSQATCDASIDRRVTANEWLVKNYRLVGLLVFHPIMVRTKQTHPLVPEPLIGETEIPLEQVMLEFPQERIFGAGRGSLWEYQRLIKKWCPTDYGLIVPL